jgi:hypothetical protein
MFAIRMGTFLLPREQISQLNKGLSTLFDSVETPRSRFKPICYSFALPISELRGRGATQRILKWRGTNWMDVNDTLHFKCASHNPSVVCSIPTGLSNTVREVQFDFETGSCDAFQSFI